jgi:anti-anti-sigma factor
MVGSDQSSTNGKPRVLVHEVSRHTTVVVLLGEHDLHTSEIVKEQLARARITAAIVVDLTRCAFLDSTIIGDLLAAKNAWPPRRVLLVMPPARSIVSRALNLVRIDQIIPTYPRLKDALMAAQPPPNTPDAGGIESRDLRRSGESVSRAARAVS